MEQKFVSDDGDFQAPEWAEETARYIIQKLVAYGPVITQKSDDGDFQAPEWAEVVVLRKDPETGEVNEMPFRAFWKEFYPGEKLGFMWRKMPNIILAKCAIEGVMQRYLEYLTRRRG
jgi:hypothetical protein